jgi:hypothetical protein
MKTLTRKAFAEADKQFQKNRPKGAFLYLSSYFDPILEEDIYCKNIIPETVGNVEKIVRSVFGSMKIKGIQTQVSKPKDDSKEWYDGRIYVFDDKNLVARITMYIKQDLNYSSLPFALETNLTLDNYAMQSRQVVSGLWPMIHKIYFTSIIKGDKAGPFGHSALREAGLELAHKPIAFPGAASFYK